MDEDSAPSQSDFASFHADLEKEDDSDEAFGEGTEAVFAPFHADFGKKYNTEKQLAVQAILQEAKQKARLEQEKSEWKKITVESEVVAQLGGGAAG